MTAAVAPLLHSRWTLMRHHAVQAAFYRSHHRFNVVPAGRRSGKTELAKRRLVRRAVRGSLFDTPSFFYAAPTYGQVKRIAWSDLKRMVPADARRGAPSETELVIPLWHGGHLALIGLDKPERIEGAPWDGGVIDEYANMKEQAWGENVYPALADREGWCDLIGVPEGRNHYYETSEKAKASLAEHGAKSEWGHYHWISADILPPHIIASAREDLDELTYLQEYEASFVNFEGRAYYAFTDENKQRLRDRYDPKQPLIICLDFNVAPGVAVVAQEMQLPSGDTGTAVIGEVYIENNSNTPAVCRRLVADWGNHTGRVEVYGDATGGARGTAQVEGSDWDIAKDRLTKGDRNAKGFGGRVSFHIKTDNPAERARVNAMNSRIHSAGGQRRLIVDPHAAPKTVRDLDGVRLLKGGSGEIDKHIDPKLTHLSDALGYYVDFRFPVATAGAWGSSTFTL